MNNKQIGTVKMKTIIIVLIKFHMQYMNTRIQIHTPKVKNLKKNREKYIYTSNNYYKSLNNKNTRVCQHSFPTIRYTVICIFSRAVNMQCDSKTVTYIKYICIYF